MEGSSRSQRLNDPAVYATTQAAGQNPARRTGIDRFRQQPLLAARSPSSAPQVGRAEANAGYGFGYAEPSQYGTPAALPTNPMSYPATATAAAYTPDQPRPQNTYTQYGSSLMYNVPQQPQPSYDPTQTYQPRQSAALEVLSTQFGVPQSYFVPGEPASAQGSGLTPQHASSQFPSLPYSQQTAADQRASVSQPYSAGMPELSETATSEALEQQQNLAQEPSSYDEAYNQYQMALRQTFENAHHGRLVEAGQSLLQISEWLLGHAEDLGLVRDEQELHNDRIKLWTEFNTCWLAVLQKQKDMTHDMLNRGLRPQPPQSMLGVEYLEKMGRDLVRMCDPMEQHGLVDYQMGVWEEQIISILSECLDLLEDGSGQAAGSGERTQVSQTSASGHGSSGR
ncbi:hypothetical protein L228DRAFT_268045 [Xylona heveae TC161]|uniref:Uncharacterized protein n=1 Tax=Xylona heveae (strain CBS 132557 / TC161) TaxID=1328760 RepID=A0A165GVS1_XYLHT|nr:hypothetical protein L228DRAFT_268045 [Xylona heveae TC161]KZF22658.1 hypothetical protein L228DRAFT_268045 [Xylona heveae TC161]